MPEIYLILSYLMQLNKPPCTMRYFSVTDGLTDEQGDSRIRIVNYFF